MNTTTSKRQSIWTDRPAPYLPGLYSLQAVTEKPRGPDVTAYRTEVKAAEAFKNTMLLHGGFDGFLLRHGERSWDVYDADGIFTAKSGDVVRGHVSEVPHEVEVDRDLLQAEARECLGNDGLSLLAVVESHAGASAADHSNFVVMCRKLVIDAKPDDMEHIYVIESRQAPCRAVGLYADVGELSAGMQDVYLERWKWLVNSWPLITHHHRDMLADRFAKVRSPFVRHLLEDCGHAAGMQHEAIVSMTTKWGRAAPRAKFLFAKHIVDTLKEGLIYAKHGAEMFDHAEVEKQAAAVVRDYRAFLP